MQRHSQKVCLRAFRQNRQSRKFFSIHCMEIKKNYTQMLTRNLKISASKLINFQQSLTMFIQLKNCEINQVYTASHQCRITNSHESVQGWRIVREVSECFLLAHELILCCNQDQSKLPIYQVVEKVSGNVQPRGNLSLYILVGIVQFLYMLSQFNK